MSLFHRLRTWLAEPEWAFAPHEAPALPGSPGSPAHPRRRQVAYALIAVLVGLTGGLGNALIAANTLSLQGALGLDPVEIAWLPVAYVMTNVSINLLLIKFRQQFGLRPFALLFTGSYALVTFGHLFVRDFWSAIVVRAVSGMAAAPLSSLCLYYAMQALPAKWRLKGIVRSRAASLAAQTATVENAQAQLLRARADMARVADLVSDGSVSLRERDQTLAALRQAEAGVRQAQAARAIAGEDIRTVAVGRGGQQAAVSGADAARRLAAIDLSNTVIRAPEAGRLSEIGVRDGQYVTAGSQLMFLVPAETWIIANFKEAQTARIRIGQPASFTVDALDGERLGGRVERISPAAGSEFAVLKSDNATGNFTKVPQRIAVRIRIDPGQPLAQRLRPGMSVEARVDTGAAR